jgi:hypothetical protein
VAAAYAGLARGLVVDRGTPTGPPSDAALVLHQTDTLMEGPDGRRRLARDVLDFAATLA